MTLKSFPFAFVAISAFAFVDPAFAAGSTCTQVSGGRNSREKTIAPPTNSTSVALDTRGGV